MMRYKLLVVFIAAISRTVTSSHVLDFDDTYYADIAYEELQELAAELNVSESGTRMRVKKLYKT